VLAEVDSVEITILADAFSDITLPGGHCVDRLPLGDAPRRSASWFEGDDLIDWPTAEPGFSALVTVKRDNWTGRILYDAGATLTGVRENMSRLDVSPGDVSVIALSHGHFDHTAGMSALVEAIGRSELPVIVHPDFWSRRRLAFPGREPVELPTPSRRAYREAGLELIETRTPSFLLEDAVLITGEVERAMSLEAAGNPIYECWRHDHWAADPSICDDQALVIRVRGKGLVVITACGHAGLLNIIRTAQSRGGTDEVFAVVGGFHLNGPVFEPRIAETVEALLALQPEVVVPAHCTGPRANHALADAFPSAYSMSAVGSRILLQATQ
jgi:7,8-dihydropterin-6-yl-methyl-4-(beta-D-ribofuranosyl)aminobenzene 5'-phosphate synthase